MVRRWLFQVAAIVFLGCPLVIQAQTASTGSGVEEKGLEYLLFQEVPLVSSTGFFATKATQAPGYTTVITSEQIEASPVRTLVDVFDYYVPGMSVVMHENAGPTLGVRGVVVDSNAKTLFMLDGQQLNHRQHFGYTGELKSPLIGDLARLEVTNGPGGIVHGSGAISGFVNLIPKNGTDYAGTFMNVERGFVEDLTKAEIYHGFNYGANRDLFLYAGFVQASGAKGHHPWDVNPTNVDTSDSRHPALEALTNGTVKVQGFPDPSYKFAAYWNHDSLHLNTFFRNETSTTNGVLYNNYRGETPRWNDASFGFRPKYVLDLTDHESVDLTGSLMLMQYAELMDSNHIYPRSRSGKSGATERQLETKIVAKTTRYNHHSLAIGMSLGRKDFRDPDLFWGSGLESSTVEAGTVAWRELAFFAEDVINLTDKLLGSYGIRYDELFFGPFRKTEYPDYKLPNTNNVSMRGAVAYEVNPTTNVKLSYQEGFRYLDAAYMGDFMRVNSELAAAGIHGVLKNFVPEKIKSTEFNFHKKIEELKMVFDVNVYYNIYDRTLHWQNFSDATPAGLSPAAIAALDALGGDGTHYNAFGKFKSVGFEIVNEWQPIDNTTLRLSYGYSNPLDVPRDVADSISMFSSTKGTWLRYPTQMVKAVVASRYFGDKLILSLESTLTSGYPREKSGYADAFGEVYSKHRFVVDIASEYKFTKNFSMKLTIKNLFANHVPHMTYMNMPYHGAMGEEMRYWYLSAKYKF